MVVSALSDLTRSGRSESARADRILSSIIGRGGKPLGRGEVAPVGAGSHRNAAKARCQDCQRPSQMQITTYLKVGERMKRMGLATGLEREMQQGILLLLARLAGPEM